MYLVWPDLPHSIGKPQKRSSTSGPTKDNTVLSLCPTTKREGEGGWASEEKLHF